ncbi:angiogenin-like [Zootoca vivipara]|uniref:angiogenin-like n=1 Tax=Zootoca vivipara TaxID=8524 RepID=UPI00293BBAF7|nr:angiogenin-like [Zootoca vivipara]XP_034991792.2 angiogenin-like [Zootoca vivipara]
MMPFKGSGLGLLTFLVSVLALGAYCAPSHQTFLKQHYDYPKSSVGNKYCDVMMKRRGLDRPCKDVNTFIHDTMNNIKAVCTESGGKDYGNGLRIALRPFTVTTCKHKGGSTRPPCKYSDNKSSRYIVIACNQNKEPVHFDESIIVTV